MKVQVGNTSYRIGGGKAGRLILLVVAALIVISCLYSVRADEVGVVTRFGRYVRKSEPGLHVKLPVGIESVTRVRIRRVFKQEFGFRTVKAGVRTQYSTGRFLDESLVLTGDLNVAEVEWIVQYRIKDPYDFLFKIDDPELTLRVMSEAIVRRVVGDRDVSDVLTVGRIEVAQEVEAGLQELLDLFESGLQIVTVKLQNVIPPEPVRPAFNEVNRAEQDKDRMVNEAWEEYNRRIPRARGEAEKTVAEAEGYHLRRVNVARGDAALFTRVFREYRNAPDVTRRRLYLETMSEVLPRLQEIVIVDETQKSILPHLNVGGAQKGGEAR